MSQSNNVCAECGLELKESSDPTAKLCPACTTKPGSSPNRARLWTWFWIIFLTTPALSLAPSGRIGLTILPIGALIASTLLAKLFAGKDEKILGNTLIFTLGILFLYGTVLTMGFAIFLK